MQAQGIAGIMPIMFSVLVVIMFFPVSVVRYFVTARCKLFYILGLEERDTEVMREL